MDSTNQLTLFGPAPHASPLQSQAPSEEQTTVAGSGRRLWSLYERFVPSGSCLKTCLGWLLSMTDWRSTEFALIWKVQGIPSSRLLFRLVPSAHPIGASDFSSWATPKASLFSVRTEDQRKAHTGGSMDMVNQASDMKPWATPRCAESSIYAERQETRSARGRGMLRDSVAIQARDTSTAGLPSLTFTGAGDEFPAWKLSAPFTDVAGAGPPKTSPENWRLSARFVERVMGFPPGWTDIE